MLINYHEYQRVSSCWEVDLCVEQAMATCSGKVCRCQPNDSDDQPKPCRHQMVSLCIEIFIFVYVNIKCNYYFVLTAGQSWFILFIVTLLQGQVYPGVKTRSIDLPDDKQFEIFSLKLSKLWIIIFFFLSFFLFL